MSRRGIMHKQSSAMCSSLARKGHGMPLDQGLSGIEKTKGSVSDELITTAHVPSGCTPGLARCIIP